MSHKTGIWWYEMCELAGHVYNQIQYILWNMDMGVLGSAGPWLYHIGTLDEDITLNMM